MLNYRFLLPVMKQLSSIRFCHNKHKELERQSSLQISEDRRITSQPSLFGTVMQHYWNEKAAIRKEKRKHTFPTSVTNITDLMRAVQSMRNFPTSFSELKYFIYNRLDRRELIEQKYLPRRRYVLKADLAAAHFLIARSGSVKFLGQQHWTGIKEERKTLPSVYIPGFFIDSIKAEGTYLYYEGLENLKGLIHLRYLSLKNLKTMNDWCMDWISNEYCSSLQHLDISGCVNVTYRALSCFYRFECLQTLNVEGIPSPPEFKLACLMLLEIKPDLEIKGVDLSIPKKIELNEAKVLPDSDLEKQIQELKS